MSQPIVIVDYDAGNLRSVARALAHVGVEAKVSADPADMADVPGVVLPGVGAAADTMYNLRQRGLVEPLHEYIDSGRPFLGVCMGLQALFDTSEEGGGQECLGVLEGTVRHFNRPELKIPHMGWNTVKWTRPHPVTEGIPDDSYFYFVHSFYPEPTSDKVSIGETTYGLTFPSIVARDNVVATQFHPEKSGKDGLAIYANFARWVEQSASAEATAAGGTH